MTGKKKRRSGIGILAIIALLICGVLIYKTAVMDKQLDAKETELEALKEQIADTELEAEDIENELRYQKTDTYIEDKARELGLTYPDETVFVPDSEKEE